MVRTSLGDSSRSEPRGYSVGLTGGIGSGKSAVAELFAELGAAIVDTDAIAHALTATSGGAIETIRKEFGAEYIGPDGALDRTLMRESVFRDPALKAKLEAILHPRIGALATARAEEARARALYVVFVVPLLVESGDWRNRIDRLLVIDCPETTQLARVSTRRGLDPQLVRQIIAQQASRRARIEAADDVLVNDGPLQQLPPRVSRLHRRYCSDAREAGQQRL